MDEDKKHQAKIHLTRLYRGYECAPRPDFERGEEFAALRKQLKADHKELVIGRVRYGATNKYPGEAELWRETRKVLSEKKSNPPWEPKQWEAAVDEAVKRVYAD